MGKIRRFILGLILVGGSLFLSACATKNIHNVQLEENGEDIKVYSSAYAECGETEEEKYLEEQIIERLEDENIYGKDLVVKCKILHYDEGNRFARYMVGFGVGAATSTIKVFLETKDGKELGNFETTANMGMGFFGGSALNTLEGSADIIVDFISKNYIKEKE